MSRAVRVLYLVFLLALTTLAGCSSDGGDAPAPPEQPPTKETLKEGKGALTGLVVDDRFRPLQDAFVLLQPTGLTTQSDVNGSFFFSDLDPGAYTVRVDVDGHEAAPTNVQIQQGLVQEVDVVARRVVNQGSTILTQEFSVYISCSVAVVGVSASAGCLDASGDSYRPGVQGINYTAEKNVTYLVTEMKTARDGNYQLTVRHDDGTALGGEQYAVGHTDGGHYTKVIMQIGTDYQNGSAVWNNDKPLAALLFYEGEGGSDVPSVPVPGVATLRPGNTGASIADKAQIVQSLFLGTPETNVEAYCLICD